MLYGKGVRVGRGCLFGALLYSTGRGREFEVAVHASVTQQMSTRKPAGLVSLPLWRVRVCRSNFAHSLHQLAAGMVHTGRTLHKTRCQARLAREWGKVRPVTRFLLRGWGVQGAYSYNVEVLGREIGFMCMQRPCRFRRGGGSVRCNGNGDKKDGC
jgi:hypothetical protein